MDAPLVRDLGLRPLPDVWAEMQAFTAERTAATRDEVWFVEHPPVYTLGMRADREPFARARRHSRRADRPRRPGHVSRPRPARGVRPAESRAARADAAQARAGARERGHRHGRGLRRRRRRRGATRRASTSRARSSRPSGLRVKRHCSYHGLAVNVAMDLAPYRRHQSVRLRGASRDGLADALRHRQRSRASAATSSRACSARLAPSY